MSALQPIAEPDARRRSIRLDLAIAVALALVLSLGWAITDWPRLSHMLLPDTDDMMRLAQVRDWLAGQGINDWTQYRVAPPHGAAMHWSRVNDFGIAGIILAATPLVGRAHAELIAVLLYPALLFAAALFLSARIGRRLWGAQAGPIAAILTALAYPGTTIFIPGRIDHHALQVVLIQLLILGLSGKSGARNGVVAGMAAGISLVVGLETAPQVAVLIPVMGLFWLVRGMEERARLGGFAAGLAGTTLLFLAFLRPTYWTAGLCDAFTPASTSGALAVGVALAALALATPRLRTWQLRLALGALFGGVALVGTLLAYPACLRGPYGVVDPLLRRLFLPYISEASSVFAQPGLDRVIATGGLMIAAGVASVWMVARERKRWPVVLPAAAVVLVSAAVTFFQMRGAYIGAPIGASVLAGLVVAARQQTRWQLPAVVAAWLVGAGMTYLEIPRRIEPLVHHGAAQAAPSAPQALCSGGDAWRQVNRFPAGVTMAGTGLAAYLIGATHHSTIGAGYHRNDAGNMAMYRFFLGSPGLSLDIARTWKADYVAFCPGDFSEIGVTANYPDSLAARLQRGAPPPWLRKLPLSGTPLQFYRVLR